jgi:hypothetical protein
MDENQTRQKAVGVEWGMQLRLSFAGFPESFKATLVGMDRGQYLICGDPKVPGIWTALNAKDQTVVRYLYRGTVYGFKCTLLGAVEKPAKLLLLSYPENIEMVSLRQHQRVQCLIPGRLELGSTTYHGMVLDLSVSGCRFAFTTTTEDDLSMVKPGEDVYLSLHLPGLSIEKPLAITVKNVRKHADKVSVGGEFKGLDDDAVQALQTYIETAEKLAQLEMSE